MQKNTSKGLAIAPILFVVALLSVLAAAIAAGSGSFQSVNNKDITKGKAEAFMSYCNELRMAIQKIVYTNGCRLSQISFEHSTLNAAYVNANSPADRRCHVFDMNGGGVLPKNWASETPAVSLEYYGDTAFWRKGTSSNELYMGIATHGHGTAAGTFGKELCGWINTINGKPQFNPPPHWQEPSGLATDLVELLSTRVVAQRRVISTAIWAAAKTILAPLREHSMAGAYCGISKPNQRDINRDEHYSTFLHTS